MSGYVDLFFTTDPAEMRDIAYEYLESAVPGWAPNPDSPDTYLLDAVVQLVVPLATAANEESRVAAAGFFQDRLGLVPGAGSPPQLMVVWTVRDTGGWTIPAGTLVSVRNPQTDDVTMHLPVDLVIPPGSTSAPAVVFALEPGALINGVAPAAGDVQLVDISDYITGVEASGLVSGGIDPETDEEFLDRGAEEMRLMARTLVRPDDFAVAAALDADVTRATAIDGFVPPSSTGVPLAVAVAVHGPDGQPVDTITKSRVAATLTERAILNMVVNVIDPTYTDIAISATAVAYPGYDTTMVKAAAESAVRDYLSPVRWGEVAEGDIRLGSWINESKVRYFELVHVLEGVPGLDVLSTLTVNGGTADVTITGTAPLPNPTTVTVTVSTP